MGPYDVQLGEPIRLAPSDWPANVVYLVHRAIERYPARVALRWKERGAVPGWKTRAYGELWGAT